MTQQEEQDMKHGWGSVILSGGQGRRMGGIDKGGLDYKGESFCGHIQKQLQALDIPCYLSRACYAGSGGREGGLEVIEDTVKGAEGEWIGPMGGIWSCFQRTGLDGLFFVSCDMPLFRKEMAAILMERWEPGADAVLWRTRDGRIQPLCGFYAATCLEALGDTIRQGNYRLMKFLNAVRCIVVDTSEAHIPDIWFANVNSPSAYRSLEGLRTPVLAVSGRKNTGKTAVYNKIQLSVSAFLAIIYHNVREILGCTCLYGCRLVGTGCGITLETWLCLCNLQLNKQRRLYGEYIAIVRADLTYFVLLHKLQGIADDVLVQGYLIIGLLVHKVI